MNLSAPFIARPVATTLLTIGVALAGHRRLLRAAGVAAAAGRLSRPSRSRPACRAPARRPWPPASPRRSSGALGAIAGVNEMTSTSTVGIARITLQFDLNRNIDGAARDVQAAINAARADLPATLRSNPTYRKVNPADAPVIDPGAHLGHARPGPALRRGVQHPAAEAVARSTGVGQVALGGSSLPAVRVELNPSALNKYGIGLERRARRPCRGQRQLAQGRARGRRAALPDLHQRPGDARPTTTGRWSSPGATARRCGCPTSPRSSTPSRTSATRAWSTASRSVLVIIYLQPSANIIETVDEVQGAAARAAGGAAQRRRRCRSSATAPPPSAPRCTRSSTRC